MQCPPFGLDFGGRGGFPMAGALAHKCEQRLDRSAVCDPQGGGGEQFCKRKFCEILPPWGAVVPAMQHAARQHKQAIASVEKPVKKN